MTDNQPNVTDNVSRTVGRDAQRNNILAARLVADVVKTTLGPKGMDKMLVDSTGNVTITNDGATILSEMEFDHPAAKLIVDIAKAQESDVGDGTTTVALLAGTLLARAEHLLDRRVHPTVLVKGYRLAAERAREVVGKLARPVENREMLLTIAKTSMTGKGVETFKQHFAELIVRAIECVASGRVVDIANIKIIKIIGERVENSSLVDGIVLEKEIAHADMPRAIENAKIALLDVPLEIRGPETEAKISLSSPEQLHSFLESEENAIKRMTEKILESGARVVFCQKGVDDVAQYYLARAGIMAFRRVPKSDMEKLSRALNAPVVARLSELTSEVLGHAGLVSEVKHGHETFTYVRGCPNPKAVTIEIRGSTNHALDEIERALQDGLGVVASVVRDGRVVAGGGAIEVALAQEIRAFARTVQGREQLAVETFADALEIVPETLAENAGLDSLAIMSELKQRHAGGRAFDGLNLFNERIEDCFEAGILEPLRVKTHAISAATEVATMILRIDDVLVSSGKSYDQGQRTPIVE